MSNETLKEWKQYYEDALLNDCIPFWLTNGVDYEYGGYFTCLDRKGELYSTDKSVWFQGRMLWVLSKLMTEFGVRDEWKKAADCGYEFLKNHCYLEDGRMPFTVTREGTYIQKRRYYFSETFAVIALAQYSIVTKNQEALALAKKTYELALDLFLHPEKLPPKFNPDLPGSITLANPMIMLATTQILRSADPANEALYNQNIDRFIREIKLHMQPQLKAVVENVSPEGKYLHSQKGRLVNPGHAIEASWFLMTEAEYRKDKDLLETGLTILNWSFEIGWDKECKGITYFVDVEGKPVEPLEAELRLWWPHNEALIAFIMAYQQTGHEEYLKQFEMVHQYAFSHFRDTEYGEWYGYLRKDGTVSKDLKGSIFKGPFHYPRCLMLVSKELGKLIDKGM